MSAQRKPWSAVAAAMVAAVVVTAEGDHPAVAALRDSATSVAPHASVFFTAVGPHARYLHWSLEIVPRLSARGRSRSHL